VPKGIYERTVGHKEKLSEIRKGKPFNIYHKPSCKCNLCKLDRGEKYKLSEEHKKAISISSKGKKLSEEHKIKLSKAKKGKRLSEEHRKKLSKPKTEETKEKIRKSLKGRSIESRHKKACFCCICKGKKGMKKLPDVVKKQISKRMKENNPMKRPEVVAKFMGDFNPAKRSEVRKKISVKNSGRNNYHWIEPIKRKCLVCNTFFFVKPKSKKKFCSLKCFGVHKTGKPQPAIETFQTFEYRMKKSAFLQGVSPNEWKGFTSFEPYTHEFSFQLRRKIRQRDNYCCQICKIQENGRKHSVHHIDYNKTNNDELNLITLCVVCHGETCFNREEWKNILHEFQELRFI